MSRLELTDSPVDVMVKMAEGNPGALTAMVSILEKHEKIDPQAMLGGLGAIFSLDTHKIYGTDIYVLWSDKCKRNTRKMLVLLRAVQLGFFPEEKLRALAHDQERKVNLSEEESERLDKQVCDRLSSFMKPEEST